MSHAPAPGPLSGLLVADCSTVLAGPYCTMLLADLGAEVIKVEPPGGDGTRTWGPPWVGSEEDGTRTAAYFLSVNRNKRSLRLDLKTDDGSAVLRRLLTRADVLVENFRAGSFERLGFGEAELARINPALVHLAISGYGPSGPAAERPGYDFIVQAVGGLMSITGATDADGGSPTKVGVAIADVSAGLHGAVAVLAALLGRGRHVHRGRVPGGDPGSGGMSDRAGGRGQRIDVSLLASTMAILVNQAQNAFVGGVAPGRLGNAHPNIVPYETFAVADGEIAVAVGSERQWLRLCEALGLAALAADPRFATNGDRVERREALRPILAERFAVHPRAEWIAVLERAEVPVGPINDIVEAFASPEAGALDMTGTVEHPAFGVLRQAGIPFRLSATPASIRTPPPLLGEQTEAILEELGYEPTDIQRLRECGAI